MYSRKRQFTYIMGGFLCLVVAVLLAAGEYVARQMPLRLHRTAWDLNSGKVRIPGDRYYYTGPGYRTWVEYNSHGLRGPEVTREKPAGILRIAFIGDSFTEASEVPFHETWSHLLVEKLRERPGLAVEGLNFGIKGYSTVQSLARYTSFARSFTPDIVVYAVCGNDWRENLDSHSRRLYREAEDSVELRRLPELSVTESFDIWLTNSSHLFKLLKSVPRMLAFSSKAKASPLRVERPLSREEAEAAHLWLLEGVDQKLRDRDDPQSQAEQRIMSRVISRLAAETGSNGARLVVVLTDTLQEWQRKQFESLAEQHNFSLFDLYAPAFEDLLAGKNWHFDVDGHWSALGNRRVAEELAPGFVTLVNIR